MCFHCYMKPNGFLGADSVDDAVTGKANQA